MYTRTLFMSVVAPFLALTLAGCPSRSRSGGSPPTAAPPPSSGAPTAGAPSGNPTTGNSGGPTVVIDEAWVFRQDATNPGVQAALGALVGDPSRRVTVRYAALRRLEEQAPSVAISLAQKLALDTTGTPAAHFLRENAIALLVREQKNQAATLALATVRKSSGDAAILVARLERVGGGN